MLRSAVIHHLAPPAVSDPDSDPAELFKRAKWHREQADRAGSPHVWDMRLRTAEDLEDKARKLMSPPPARQLLKPAA